MPRAYRRRAYTAPPGTKLPNEGSDIQTPTTLAIDLRYEQLRIWRRWDWARFCRLCTYLNITPAELASIACIPHHYLKAFEERNRLYFLNTQNRAAALVLTLLEAHVAKAYTHDIVPSALPNLNEIASAR